MLAEAAAASAVLLLRAKTAQADVPDGEIYQRSVRQTNLSPEVRTWSHCRFVQPLIHFISY